MESDDPELAIACIAAIHRSSKPAQIASLPSGLSCNHSEYGHVSSGRLAFSQFLLHLSLGNVQDASAKYPAKYARQQVKLPKVQKLRNLKCHIRDTSHTQPKLV